MDIGSMSYYYINIGKVEDTLVDTENGVPMVEGPMTEKLMEEVQ